MQTDTENTTQQAGEIANPPLLHNCPPIGCNGYSTGTEFSKALSEAQNRETPNTAAAIAKEAKNVLESRFGIKVERLTVKGSEGMIVVGRLNG